MKILLMALLGAWSLGVHAALPSAVDGQPLPTRGLRYRFRFEMRSS